MKIDWFIDVPCIRVNLSLVMQFNSHDINDY